MIMKHCILLKPFRVSVIHTRMNQLQWNWNKFNPLKNGGKGNVIEENIIVPKNCLGYFLEKSRVFKFLFSKFAFLTDAKISNMKNLMFFLVSVFVCFF